MLTLLRRLPTPQHKRYDNKTMERDTNSSNDGGIELVAEAPAEIRPPQAPKPHRYSRYLIAAAILSIFAVIVFALLLSLDPKKPETKVVPAKPVTPITINTQSLDNGTLNKISVRAGATQTSEQLTIAPDTLFKQGVEVQGNVTFDKDLAVQGSTKINKNLEVGGSLTIGGAITMQGAVGIGNNLAVRGSLSVGGTLSAASISVGSLAITNISVSGALNFGGHIVPTGAQPTIRASTAAGGGSAVIIGNDTAGTITITTGNTNPNPGELAIITFRAGFSGTPKVQLTPINGAASALNYYATRSSGFFTLATSSAPAVGVTYVFDYLVTQ